MKINRRDLLAGAVSAGVAAAKAEPQPPNIVYLMADQLRAQSVGCLGNEEVRTPNIDRLASEGALLANTFANSPVCCPARAAILTGQYAHGNGMVANDLRLREDSVSLAKRLREAGYQTAFVGKWHLDGGPRRPGFVPPGPRRQGFDWWAGNECSHEHFRNWYFRDTPEQIFLETFETKGYADVGIQFLKEAAKERRPFYLTVQWGPPHDPYKAPAEYSRLYEPEKLTMRPNYREGERVPGRREIAEYYAMVTAIDDGVGQILRALDELGFRDNTIVLFSSDHGDMLGSQGRRLKRKPWEESIRIPGILRWPGKVRAGSRPGLFFTHVDFAPTLLGMAGVRIPKSMQGQNLAGQILSGAGARQESAYFQIFGPFAGDGTEDGWRGVRTERYMYARFRERPWVLYDLQKDPFEMKNLVEERSAQALLQEMDRQLKGWMERTGDSWKFNWSHPVEDRGRLYRHGAFYSVGEYLEWAKQHPDLDAR